MIKKVIVRLNENIIDTFIVKRNRVRPNLFATKSKITDYWLYE